MEILILIVGAYFGLMLLTALGLTLIQITPQHKSDPFWDWFFGGPPSKPHELKPTIGEEHRLRFISDRAPEDPWTNPADLPEDTDLAPKRYDPRVCHGKHP